MNIREKTKKINVGNIQIGGNNNVVIQSMTNTKTKNVDETLMQINALYEKGCQLIRVAVLGIDDANALSEIVKKSPIPVVADIHFNYKFALTAADAGVAKIRINPGNIGIEENILKVVNKCKEKNIPIRIGVNSGSLPKHIVKKYGWNYIAAVEALKEHIDILEKHNFTNIIYSVKSTNAIETIKAYKECAKRWNYPAHLGITEAGSELNGAIKSSFGLGLLLYEGYGNTIRISLSDDPIKEIDVCKKLLNNNGLYDNIVEVIACPTCGRLDFNLSKVVSEIEEYTKNMNFPLKIAILGCVVNGPGEASQADIGIAGGKDSGIIFKKGKIFKTVEENQLVFELKKLIDEYYNNFLNKK